MKIVTAVTANQSALFALVLDADAAASELYWVPLTNGYPSGDWTRLPTPGAPPKAPEPPRPLMDEEIRALEVTQPQLAATMRRARKVLPAPT